MTHESSGHGVLCGPGWIHAYTDPWVAAFMNPAHANFKNPHLWEAEGEIGLEDHGLKCGTTRLTTIRRIPVPEITIEQRVEIAIRCALQTDSANSPVFSDWARKWLSGEDRTHQTAQAVWAASRHGGVRKEAWAWARAASADAAEEKGISPLDLTAIIRKVCNKENGRIDTN